jgi:ribosomal protein S27E
MRITCPECKKEQYVLQKLKKKPAALYSLIMGDTQLGTCSGCGAVFSFRLSGDFKLELCDPAG